MKKVTIIILIVVFLLLGGIVGGLSTQPGSNDWEYNLPNDYVIWRINSRNIVCGKKDSEYSISEVGGEYITKFCYNDRYVCVQCVDVSENLSDEIDTSDPYYFIIDTVKDDISDSLSQNKYQENIKSLKIEGLSEWINTYPAPDDAEYPY